MTTSAIMDAQAMLNGVILRPISQNIYKHKHTFIYICKGFLIICVIWVFQYEARITQYVYISSKHYSTPGVNRIAINQPVRMFVIVIIWPCSLKLLEGKMLNEICYLASQDSLFSNISHLVIQRNLSLQSTSVILYALLPCTDSINFGKLSRLSDCW